MSPRSACSTGRPWSTTSRPCSGSATSWKTGPEWFAGHGRNGGKGLRSYSVSGRVKEPGRQAGAGRHHRAGADRRVLRRHGRRPRLQRPTCPAAPRAASCRPRMGDLPLEFGQARETRQLRRLSRGRHPVGPGRYGRWRSTSDALSSRTKAAASARPAAPAPKKPCSSCRRTSGTRRCLSELGKAMADASICGLGSGGGEPAFLGDEAFPRGAGMTDKVTFTLDGTPVEAQAGRDDLAGGPSPLASTFPHLCWSNEPGLPRGRQLPRLHGRDRGRARPRRLLHPHAHRGHGRQSVASDRAKAARKMVFEMLVADQPERKTVARSRRQVLGTGRSASRPRAAVFRPESRPRPRIPAIPAMRVNLDACIQCNLVRPRLPRDPGQRRHRHGLSRPRRQGRLRLRRPDGRQHLRRLRRMRPGLPDRRADGSELCWTTPAPGNWPDAQVDSVCPYCGVGCQITYQPQGRRDCLFSRRQGRPLERTPAVRQGPLRLRLREAPAQADQAVDPQG